MSISALGKWLRAPWADRLALLEALLLLSLAQLAIRYVPFRRLAGCFGEVGLESGLELPDQQAAAVRRSQWAIAAASRRLPWPCRCLAQALAAWLMVSRRGIAGTVYFGVRPDPDRAGALLFHAWLRCGSQAVTGGRGEAYQRLGCFSRGAAPHA